MVRAALGLTVVLLLAFVACAPPSIDGTPISGNQPLPERDTTGNDDNNSAPPPAVTQSAPTVAPPVDGGTIAQPSKACDITNAALCFTFEGNAQNQSPDGVQPSVVTSVAYEPGHENEAAQFTTASAMQFAANPAFELPASAATIEAWIKRQDTGGDAVVFDDDGRFSLTIQANGTIICKSSGGAVSGDTIVPTGTWVHVACVVDGTTLLAYLNGAQEAIGTGAVGSAPTLTASIGANAPPGSAEGDQLFVGEIDSFRVLSVARQAAEIATDAAGP